MLGFESMDEDIISQAEAVAARQDAFWRIADIEAGRGAHCPQPGCTREELHQHIPTDVQQWRFEQMLFEQQLLFEQRWFNDDMRRLLGL